MFEKKREIQWKEKKNTMERNTMFEKKEKYNEKKNTMFEKKEKYNEKKIQCLKKRDIQWKKKKIQNTMFEINAGGKKPHTIPAGILRATLCVRTLAGNGRPWGHPRKPGARDWLGGPHTGWGRGGPSAWESNMYFRYFVHHTERIEWYETVC